MNIILLGGWYIQRKPHTWSTAKGCFSCLKNPLKRLAAILCSASQMACYCELLSKKVKKIDAWFLNLMWHSALWDPYSFHIQILYWIWIFFIKTPYGIFCNIFMKSKIFFFNPLMNYGSSKSAKFVLSKSIFDVKS